MNINFEEDKQNSLTKVNDAESLSEQALKLKEMEKNLAAKEDEIKKLKKDIDVISGEVIPTMMQEMNLSSLKLADGYQLKLNLSTVPQYHLQKKKRRLTGFVIMA